jgi:hypothetical protein
VVTTPSLVGLARITDLSVRVAAARVRLGGDAEARVTELAALVLRARAGVNDARVALLACAQALAADDDDVLAPRLLVAAEALRATHAAHMLRDAPPHRAIGPKGRLREVCVPEHIGWSTVEYRLRDFRLGYSESSALENLVSVARRWVGEWRGEPAHPAEDVYPRDDPAYHGHWVWEGVPDGAPLRASAPYVAHVRLPPDRLLHPSPVAVRKALAAAELRDVLVIASRRPSSAAIAREVARAITWSRRVEVRRALCMNPFTPTGLVLRFLPTLASHVVAEVSRGPVHPLVRETARALLEAPASSKAALASP